MSGRRRTEREEIDVYVNNKTLKHVNSIKYLGIILDNKMTLKIILTA